MNSLPFDWRTRTNIILPNDGKIVMAKNIFTKEDVWFDPKKKYFIYRSPLEKNGFEIFDINGKQVLPITTTSSREFLNTTNIIPPPTSPSLEEEFEEDYEEHNEKEELSMDQKKKFIFSNFNDFPISCRVPLSQEDIPFGNFEKMENNFQEFLISKTKENDIKQYYQTLKNISYQKTGLFYCGIGTLSSTLDHYRGRLYRCKNLGIPLFIIVKPIFENGKIKIRSSIGTFGYIPKTEDFQKTITSTIRKFKNSVLNGEDIGLKDSKNNFFRGLEHLYIHTMDGSFITIRQLIPWQYRRGNIPIVKRRNNEIYENRKEISNSMGFQDNYISTPDPNIRNDFPSIEGLSPNSLLHCDDSFLLHFERNSEQIQHQTQETSNYSYTEDSSLSYPDILSSFTESMSQYDKENEKFLESFYGDQ